MNTNAIVPPEPIGGGAEEAQQVLNFGSIRENGAR
jgi:hypothetical protein